MTVNRVAEKNIIMSLEAINMLFAPRRIERFMTDVYC